MAPHTCLLTLRPSYMKTPQCDDSAVYDGFIRRLQFLIGTIFPTLQWPGESFSGHWTHPFCKKRIAYFEPKYNGKCIRNLYEISMHHTENERIAAETVDHRADCMYNNIVVKFSLAAVCAVSFFALSHGAICRVVQSPKPPDFFWKPSGFFYFTRRSLL